MAKSKKQRHTEEIEEALESNGYYYSYGFDDDDGWPYGWQYDWEYDRPGYVQNMGQYYQMKLMTLLRKLDIVTAREEADDRGW